MALLAWQAPERNEWHSEIGQAIGDASARGARMFSLADQHTTAGILAAHERPAHADAVRTRRAHYKVRATS